MQKKNLTKYYNPFTIKMLNELGTEGKYLNIVKATCSKHTANSRLSGERLKAFSLRSRTRQGCPLLQYI